MIILEHYIDYVVRSFAIIVDYSTWTRLVVNASYHQARLNNVIYVMLEDDHLRDIYCPVT